MSTVAPDRTEAAGGPPAQARERGAEPATRPPVSRGAFVRRHWRPVLLAAVVVGWLVLWGLFRGTQTLELGGADKTDVHLWLNGLRDSFDTARSQSPFFTSVVQPITDGLNGAVAFLQHLLSQPSALRPVPEVGWLGVLALLAWLAFVLAGVRSMILVAACVLLFGFFGYWQQSIDTLIVTFVAVGLCALTGPPLGIWMARSRRVSAVLSPLLDLAQTLPSFAYLAPLALVFGIGPASAIVTTIIYSLPPLVRITEHGIRNVSPTTLEAVTSMGGTAWQTLTKVQLPMARRTIVVGINQCTMAALSMATIAALINGPGLGQPVLQSLQSLDVGSAFVSGLAIVLMAIMLDRTTTAASERSGIEARVQRGSRSGGLRGPKGRRAVAIASAALAAVAIWLSHSYLALAKFPSSPDLGGPLAQAVSAATDWTVHTFSGFTEWLKEAVTALLVNPLESLLAQSPWWTMALVLLGIAFALGGRRACAATLVCEAVILGTGLWNESMKTLATTLVATFLVVIAAVIVGVLMGRSKLVDSIVRPVLDAFQTIPSFVYLVPALALFGPTRFTAIVAAVAYGVPIATKLVADGIRGVSPVTVEASESMGTTPWQMVTKVQLPMSRAAVILAANQGLLYVLSMVVVGGLVGGGGLGYLVVSGFSQSQLFGKGLAAGIAITALGVMLDRITQHAAARLGNA
ncbi:Putative glycine betaine ABC transport system integral membrane protein [Sinomonas atrocyanea]|uniref:Putative glycine betaine ABC transport system integral membrane protein n=1 Tax=Sinomonas atrocyanea TaxID=37927 RepID=A0A127A3S0_9MICC|nr:ABC transporter permease subunit [Sinomonas atrocyanea]AMM34118.1 Putative glycine betaine ABC transport system integral membrane protein [Sinomonas atrocyanea]GEB65179.1 glycine/betaine ABC transporter permease [Sinomonas atrocyanea]GGG58650.1 glycine/betaine ABC transporter permease [Sinomonas atrocyanea]